MRSLAAALALVLTLAAAPASAGLQQPKQIITGVGTLLSGVALNASAATRTFDLALANEFTGFGILTVYVNYTNSAATDVQMSCTSKPSSTVSAATLQSCAVSAGTCTSTDAGWNNSVSGDEVFVWRVDINNYPGTLSCVFSGTSAGAGDLITVDGWLATE